METRKSQLCGACLQNYVFRSPSSHFLQRGLWGGGLCREGEPSYSERGPNLIQRRGEVTSGPLSHVRDPPRPAPCRPVMGAGNAEPKWQVPPSWSSWSPSLQN